MSVSECVCLIVIVIVFLVRRFYDGIFNENLLVQIGMSPQG